MWIPTATRRLSRSFWGVDLLWWWLAQQQQQLLLLLLLLLIPLCEAHVETLDLTVTPRRSSGFAWVEGVVVTPATIDLSDLVFWRHDDDDDDDNNAKVRHPTFGDKPPPSSPQEYQDSVLSVAVVRYPGHVVTMHSTRDHLRCQPCLPSAISAGHCTEAQRGQYILGINPQSAKTATVGDGFHFTLNIPARGNVQLRLPTESATIPLNGTHTEQLDTRSGHYIIAFANCNPLGRNIRIQGVIVWKSWHGLLPGSLLPFALLYAGMAALYFILLLSFVGSMRKHAQARIPMEKWIVVTIVLATLEIANQVGGFVYYNNVGHHPPMVLAFTRIALGAMKHGLSRCLFLLVSLGWGMVRESVGRCRMCSTVLLGILYTISLTIHASLDWWVENESDNFGKNRSNEMLVYTILRVTLAITMFCGFVFFMWSVISLILTIRLLHRSGRPLKTTRLRYLAWWLAAFIVSEIIFTAFQYDVTNDDSSAIGDLLFQDDWETHTWTVQASHDISYAIILVGVARLWWPNPFARVYAHAIPLPSDADGLEMLTGAVPDSVGGYEDYPESSMPSSDSFTID